MLEDDDDFSDKNRLLDEPPPRPVLEEPERKRKRRIDNWPLFLMCMMLLAVFFVIGVLALDAHRRRQNSAAIKLEKITPKSIERNKSIAIGGMVFEPEPLPPPARQPSATFRFEKGGKVRVTLRADEGEWEIVCDGGK